jgi:urease accessory protein
VLSIASFMGAMILAAVVGFYGLMSIPVEEGILLSVAVIFALIGFSSKLSLNLVVSIVAFFGFFHGFAHGAEFQGGAFSMYILGFSLSTFLLHVSGMALAYTFSRYYNVSQTPAVEKI